jgi:hypothetical protein
MKMTQGRQNLNNFLGSVQSAYNSLQPFTWIVNFENGYSTSSKKQNNDFNTISKTDKQRISALRVRIDKDKIYTIRKTCPSIFYHIKAGRSTLAGKYPELSPPLVKERFGCCYNKQGDSFAIEFDNHPFIQEIGARMKVVESQQPHYEHEKHGLIIDYSQFVFTPEMKKELMRPVVYRPRIIYYPKENILSKRVNVALFGPLEELEESGTPPLVMVNDKEVEIPIENRTRNP